MRILIQSLTISLCLVTAACSGDSGQELFNGKDLNGWRGDGRVWKVVNGLLTGETKNSRDITTNTFLIWQEFEVDDFELHVVFRLEGPNSGIQYRSRVDTTISPFTVVGYQADLHTTPNYTGMLYEERGRRILAERGQKVIFAKDGGKSLQETVEVSKPVNLTEWNDFDISAVGNHMIHKLNGKVTADVTDNDAKHAALRGCLALQVSSGPPIKVQFKSLWLKRLGQRESNDK
jgi:hypothetical protein